MIFTQDNLLQLAKRSVPSFKWAIGAAGLLALAAIVVKWGLNLPTLFLVAGVLLVLAMAFVALQWVSKLQAGHTSLMATFLAWSLLLMLVAALGMVLSSAALNWPWPLRSWIAHQITLPAVAASADKDGSGAAATPATGTALPATGAPSPAPEGPSQRIETLAVRWVFTALPDATLEALFQAEVQASDYWFADDNLKFMSDEPRQEIQGEQNRAIGRGLLQELGAGTMESRHGTTLAVFEMNQARSLTLPFGALHLDEEIYPPGAATRLARSELARASSGIELICPESRAPYDDDPVRDACQEIVGQRPRKNPPGMTYRREGRRAEITLNAGAAALADWIDRLPTTGDFSTPLPAEFRIVLLNGVASLPLHPERFCDVMSVIQSRLRPGRETSPGGPTAARRPLRTSWLSLKPNGAAETHYRVEWQSDDNYTTRGGPEEERLPACRVSLFRAVRTTAAEFQQATVVPEPAAETGPGGVVIFAADPAISSQAERIRSLIGSTPLVEIPLGTGLDAALAWCRKARPAVVMVSTEAFGPGEGLVFRAFVREALKAPLSAAVLRVTLAEKAPAEYEISGFEEDEFSRLTEISFKDQTDSQRWQLTKSFLTETLSR